MRTSREEDPPPTFKGFANLQPPRSNPPSNNKSSSTSDHVEAVELSEVEPLLPGSTNPNRADASSASDEAPPATMRGFANIPANRSNHLSAVDDLDQLSKANADQRSRHSFRSISQSKNNDQVPQSAPQVDQDVKIASGVERASDKQHAALPSGKSTMRAEYKGFQPMTYDDIVDKYEEREQEAQGGNNEQFDQNMNEDSRQQAERKIGAHFVANIILLLSLLLTVFTIIVFIPVISCALGLCSATDRSSSGRTGLAVFQFDAPLLHVWGAFSASIAGVLVSSIHLYFLRANKLGVVGTLHAAMQIRTGTNVFLKYEYFVEAVLTLPLFVVVGFGVSWFTAGAFMIGVFLVVIASRSQIYIATYGAVCIAAAAEKSFIDAVYIMFRASAAMGVLGVTLPILGSAFTYLVFRDVRALLGLFAGVSTVALMSRVATGIFGAANDVARSIVGSIELNVPDDDPHNPASVASIVGDSVGSTAGVGADFLESLAAAIAVTAASASTLPFVKGNRYALCVYNHLHIDYNCIAQINATVKLSLAAQICRSNDYYQVFPPLTFMQSNSLFVALPFLVVILGLFCTMLGTVHLFFVQIEEEDDIQECGHKVERSMRINMAVSALAFLLGSLAISYGLFGPISSFQKGLPSTKFPRRELNSANPVLRCEPRKNANGIAESNLPNFIDTIGPYMATNELGDSFPPPSEIPWRMLMLILLGQTVALCLDLWMRFFTGAKYEPTMTIAQMGECGAEDVITQGIGSALISTSVPLILVLAASLVSHILLGGFGVGLLSVSMLSASMATVAASAFEPISRSAIGISRLGRRPPRARRVLEELGHVGSRFAITSKSVCAAASLIIGLAVISDLMQVSRLVPTARQIIGLISGTPQRHISSIDTLSAISPNVFVSVALGVLLPVAFVALPLLGMSRTGYAVIVEARRQLQESPQMKRGDGNATPDIKKCVRISTRFAFFEMLLPVFIVFVVPLAVGFGLGQRALIGFLLSATSSGYLLAVFLSTAGTSWRNAKTMVERKEFGEENAKGSSWHRSVSVADGVGVFLRRTSTPGLTILVKLVPVVSLFAVPVMQPGNSLWYIGLIILLVAGILTVFLQLLCYNYQKNIRKKAQRVLVVESGRGDDSGQEDSTGVSGQVVSPFYEDGHTVARRRIAPVSVLGHGRIEPRAIDDYSVESLDRIKMDKQD